jgi:hypothetical protein
VARRYPEIFRELAAAGDELGLHCHPWRWDDRHRWWVSDFGDQRWVDHCVQTSFRAFRETFERPCRSFRFGDRWMNAATLALVERLGARFDLTVEPGQKEVAIPEPFSGKLTDYTLAPRHPYRPTLRDFQKPGLPSTHALWEVPFATGTVDASRRFSIAQRRTTRAKLSGPGAGTIGPTTAIVRAFDAASRSGRRRRHLRRETRIARVGPGCFRADLLTARREMGDTPSSCLPERLRDGNAHRIAVRIAGTDVSPAGTCTSSDSPERLRQPDVLTFVVATTRRSSAG